jgi:hypothetical protein
VKSRFGESGRRLDDGTTECPFEAKKSKYDCRISELVIIKIAAATFRKPTGKSKNRTGRNRSLHWRDGFHAVLTASVISADQRRASLPETG